VSCAFSPDGSRLLSGSADDTLKLWDASSGECLRTFSGHSLAVVSCAFSPDGSRLLSGSADNTLKLWDATTGECLETRPHDDGEFNDLLETWSEQSPKRCQPGNGIHVLDPKTQKRLWSLYVLPGGEVLRINEVEQRPINVTPNTWRYLRWRTADGELHHAEAFGPLEKLCVPMPDP
jgi:WD40 repeat protein